MESRFDRNDYVYGPGVLCWINACGVLSIKDGVFNVPRSLVQEQSPEIPLVTRAGECLTIPSIMHYGIHTFAQGRIRMNLMEQRAGLKFIG